MPDHTVRIAKDTYTGINISEIKRFLVRIEEADVC